MTDARAYPRPRQISDSLPTDPVRLAGMRLKGGLKLADALLRGVETTAWELRNEFEALRATASEGASRIGDEATRRKSDLTQLALMAGRMTRTGWLLTKIATGYRLQSTRAAFTSRSSAARGLQRQHRKAAALFREVSEQEGGAFLKVGQLLSARPDLMPKVWVSELAALQDSAPAEPFDVVRTIVEAEFGRPISEVFASFGETPIAAASIGQVHRAELFDGTVVAVKVQRPNIDLLIDADMRLLTMFINSMRGSFPDTDIETITTELEEMIRLETNYEREVEFATRAREFFAGNDAIVVPRVYTELSTRRVITTEFVVGQKITDWLDNAQREGAESSLPPEASQLLATLLSTYVQQVLELGAFQADPHPGNFLVREDNKLVLLDFGCAREVDHATRRRYVELMQAFVVGDQTTVVRALTELGFRTRTGSPDTLLAFAEVILAEFRNGLAQGKSMRWPTREQITQRAGDVLKQATRDPVEVLPADFVMIARVFGTLGGMFTHYEPQIDYATVLLPTFARAMARTA